MINMSKFAETLDYLIYERNITQKLDAKTLAGILGIEGSTITRYLNEERAPTVQNLILLADYFNCSTDYLLGRETENYVRSFHACPPFSEQIQKIISEKNETCLGFSKAVKIHPSRVYDWKNGKRQPSLDNIIKIAEHLDCSVDFVLGREV